MEIFVAFQKVKFVRDIFVDKIRIGCKIVFTPFICFLFIVFSGCSESYIENYLTSNKTDSMEFESIQLNELNYQTLSFSLDELNLKGKINTNIPPKKLNDQYLLITDSLELLSLNFSTKELLFEKKIPKFTQDLISDFVVIDSSFFFVSIGYKNKLWKFQNNQFSFFDLSSYYFNCYSYFGSSIVLENEKIWIPITTGTDNKKTILSSIEIDNNNLEINDEIGFYGPIETPHWYPNIETPIYSSPDKKGDIWVCSSYGNVVAKYNTKDYLRNLKDKIQFPSLSNSQFIDTTNLSLTRKEKFTITENYNLIIQANSSNVVMFRKNKQSYLNENRKKNSIFDSPWEILTNNLSSQEIYSIKVQEKEAYYTYSLLIGNDLYLCTKISKNKIDFKKIVL